MPMKTIGVIKILKIVFYLSFTRCSLDYVNSVANSTEKEDKLWFSFNKETLDGFRSNLTDVILNEKCITNVPFGVNTSLGNFLNVFCLFYQNSKLVNDENFLEAFEKYYNSCNEEEEERFKKASFEDFFKQQDIKMNEIIMGRETFNDTIKVDIKNGRVILEMTGKIKNNSPETNTSESSNLQDTIKTSKIGFIIKFDEMFLQGLLGKGYLSSLGDFNDEYVAKGFDPTKTSSDEPLYELFKLCSRIDHFIRVSRGGSLIKTEEESRKECLLEIFESFETYTLSLFKNRKSSGPFEYLEKLMEKVTARAMYHFEENLDIFSSYSQEYTESVNTLKSLLKQYFKEMNLSEASIERLVMLCFELNV